MHATPEPQRPGAFGKEKMSAFKSDFLRVMSERGFIHQISDETGLDQLFAKETVTAYVGYDATATSLHIGNLISATMLYWMQETGHRPIALMGGGTSMIGDPSFRDDQRSLLTPEAIATDFLVRPRRARSTRTRSPSASRNGSLGRSVAIHAV